MGVQKKVTNNKRDLQDIRESQQFLKLDTSTRDGKSEFRFGKQDSDTTPGALDDRPRASEFEEYVSPGSEGEENEGWRFKSGAKAIGMSALQGTELEVIEEEDNATYRNTEGSVLVKRAK